MPAAPRVPAYRRHKPTGQARVILAGRHVYLGPYNSPDSREKYNRVVAEHLASLAPADPPPEPRPGTFPDLSVNELLLRYLDFAETYYQIDGVPTGEVGNLKDAMRTLTALYGTTAAAEFGPKSLKAAREHMIGVSDLSRKVINGRVDRIKRIFKWGVSEELIPPAVYEGLRSVSGLRLGRSCARESEPVLPVDNAVVDATLKHLPPVLADMVRLQRLTGIRSGNLVAMRPCDLDRTGKVWVFQKARHKTAHHGRRLEVPIGPKAQAILRPYLDQTAAEAVIFTPALAEAWRQQQRQLHPRARKNPPTPCEMRRVEAARRAARRRKHRRPVGEQYTTHSYRRAIDRAIAAANKKGHAIPDWFPHQLRHNRGTEVRKRFGIEGAQLALGHAKANITEVYAERDLARAKAIAAKTG